MSRLKKFFTVLPTTNFAKCTSGQIYDTQKLWIRTSAANSPPSCVQQLTKAQSTSTKRERESLLSGNNAQEAFLKSRRGLIRKNSKS